MHFMRLYSSSLWSELATAHERVLMRPWEQPPFPSSLLSAGHLPRGVRVLAEKLKHPPEEAVLIPLIDLRDLNCVFGFLPAYAVETQMEVPKSYCKASLLGRCEIPGAFLHEPLSETRFFPLSYLEEVCCYLLLPSEMAKELQTFVHAVEIDYPIEPDLDLSLPYHVEFTLDTHRCLPMEVFREIDLFVVEKRRYESDETLLSVVHWGSWLPDSQYLRITVDVNSNQRALICVHEINKQGLRLREHYYVLTGFKFRGQTQETASIPRPILSLWHQKIMETGQDIAIGENTP